jgi:hypothetical protein
MSTRIALLMGFAAATLAVMASLHFSGTLSGSKPFNPTHAGIAEALICVALSLGAATLLRGSRNARSVAIAALGFAILGFIVGLSFTTRGGDTIDIAYHVTVLPLLVVALVALVIERRPDSIAPRRSDEVEGEPC